MAPEDKKQRKMEEKEEKKLHLLPYGLISHSANPPLHLPILLHGLQAVRVHPTPRVVTPSESKRRPSPFMVTPTIHSLGYFLDAFSENKKTEKFKEIPLVLSNFSVSWNSIWLTIKFSRTLNP